MRIIEPTRWTTQRWRNGGGITHEVFREGPPESFRFRVSVAEVRVPGPFSPFPGLDRSITLLDGAGFSLRFAGGRVVRLETPFEPFQFSGDEAVDCTLLDGPVLDLNLMVDRSRASLTVERSRVEGLARMPSRDEQLFVFVLRGALALEAGHAGSRSLVVAETDFEVDASEPAELLIARLQARVPA